MEGIYLPTIVAQSIIANFTTTIGDGVAIWRNTIDEILHVLHSFFELVSPTAVVLIESEGNITVPLGPVLSAILSGDVNFTVVEYDGDESLSSVLGNLCCNTSLRNCSAVFIMNVPEPYANDVIMRTMVCVLYYTAFV